MGTSVDLETLFGHTDAALDLLARASGELGAAGSAAFNDNNANPFALFSMVKKLLSQRRARRLLRQATPHLEAIRRAHVEATTWLATAPDVGAPGMMVLDVFSENMGIVGAWIDVGIHGRIETQLLELNALLDEMGRLHGRLRARRSATPRAPVEVDAPPAT